LKRKGSVYKPLVENGEKICSRKNNLHFVRWKVFDKGDEEEEVQQRQEKKYCFQIRYRRTNFVKSKGETRGGRGRGAANVAGLTEPNFGEVKIQH